MDTETGQFVAENKAEAWMKRIQMHEIVEIKGAVLEVVSIGRREITLKLLSRDERKKLKDILSDYEQLAANESKRQRENMLKHQK